MWCKASKNDRGNGQIQKVWARAFHRELQLYSGDLLFARKYELSIGWRDGRNMRVSSLQGAMPPFGDKLSAQDLEDVANYIIEQARHSNVAIGKFASLTHTHPASIVGRIVSIDWVQHCYLSAWTCWRGQVWLEELIWLVSTILKFL